MCLECAHDHVRVAVCHKKSARSANVEACVYTGHGCGGCRGSVELEWSSLSHGGVDTIAHRSCITALSTSCTCVLQHSTPTERACMCGQCTDQGLAYDVGKQECCKSGERYDTTAKKCDKPKLGLSKGVGSSFRPWLSTVSFHCLVTLCALLLLRGKRCMV